MSVLHIAAHLYVSALGCYTLDSRDGKPGSCIVPLHASLVRIYCRLFIYAAFTCGRSSKWSYLSHTQEILLPNHSDCDLFALLARLGGLGLRNLARYSNQEYNPPRLISKPLVNLITEHHSYQCVADQMEAKSTVTRQRHQQITQAAEDLKLTLSYVRRMAMEFASEKRASSRLTTLPIEEFGFSLHMQGCLH